MKTSNQTKITKRDIWKREGVGNVLPHISSRKKGKLIQKTAANFKNK